MQLIQRLGEKNQQHENVATIRAKAVGRHNDNKLRGINSIEESQLSTMSSIEDNEDEQALQNRLVTLRKEVTTMQKKVDDMKAKMEHVRNIQRSSSASAILGGATAGGGAVGVHSRYVMFPFQVAHIMCFSFPTQEVLKTALY